ncbi:MAG: hypothetical protein IPK16_02400 [Anaerolineales bacterium]|nr:hypothetical protein [Anaerolineales bacterium]
MPDNDSLIARTANIKATKVDSHVITRMTTPDLWTRNNNAILIDRDE